MIIMILGGVALVALIANLVVCIKTLTQKSGTGKIAARAIFNVLTIGATLAFFNQEAMEVVQSLTSAETFFAMFR